MHTMSLPREVYLEWCGGTRYHNAVLIQEGRTAVLVLGCVKGGCSRKSSYWAWGMCKEAR